MILNSIDFQLTDTGLQSKRLNSPARFASNGPNLSDSDKSLRKSRADRKMPIMLAGFLNVENIRVDCRLVCASNS